MTGSDIPDKFPLISCVVTRIMRTGDVSLMGLQTAKLFFIIMLFLILAGDPQYDFVSRAMI